MVANVTGLGAIFERKGLQQAVIRLIYKAAFARVQRVFFQNPDDQKSRLSTEGWCGRPRQTCFLAPAWTCSGSLPRPRGQGPFTFLFVGRLLKAKGVEDLVAAARIVAGKRKGVRVILLGRRDDGDPDAADPDLLDAAQAGGIVELPGNVDDVRPYLAQADCVVLPSYYREGTPRSLLEAAAMGKPLIAADSIGTREPIRSGENGFLCRPRDSEHLAARMIEMCELSDEARGKMGAASRRIAEERFDERVVISKYLQAIEQLAARG